MLLIYVISLALVVAGTVIIAQRSLWLGIVVIGMGVLIFLLRHSIIDGANDDAAVMLLGVPFVRTRWSHTNTGYPGITQREDKL